MGNDDYCRTSKLMSPGTVTRLGRAPRSRDDCGDRAEDEPKDRVDSNTERDGVAEEVTAASIVVAVPRPCGHASGKQQILKDRDALDACACDQSQALIED